MNSPVPAEKVAWSSHRSSLLMVRPWVSALVTYDNLHYSIIYRTAESCYVKKVCHFLIFWYEERRVYPFAYLKILISGAWIRLDISQLEPTFIPVEKWVGDDCHEIVELQQGLCHVVLQSDSQSAKFPNEDVNISDYIQNPNMKVRYCLTIKVIYNGTPLTEYTSYLFLG